MLFMADKSELEIEVVYALPDTQTVIALTVPAGTTVGEAIARSEIAVKHPEIKWDWIETAVFGRRVSSATLLNAYDRVELCRPLIADPKLARRRRAQKKASGSRR
jgi:putative ubiquitin-RnfH superfamily antitoxin RatB of RatAB toxin-antitoxin module